MKILIYQPRVYYYTGGGEVYPLQNAKFFAKLGHEVTILTTRAKFLQPCEYFEKFAKENPDVKIEYLELDDNFKDIYDVPAGMNQERWDRECIWVARLAYEFLSHHKYDIITVHYVLDALAVPFNCKYALHLHGVPNEISYICKLVLEKQKNLIAVSKNVSQKWIELGAYPNMQISTNAINEEQYQSNPNIKKDIDMLFVGRLVQIKGIQYTLQALKILKTNYSFTPHFTIIGEGPYRQELENFVREFGIEKQVSFCGLVVQDRLLEYYQRAKIAVFPSYEKEGIMSTLLEAASCRVPSITTRGTSMEEFAKDNENALLVNPKDADDLSEKIFLLLNDEKLKEKIATNAYNHVREKYTWLVKAKELIKIYQEDMK